MVKRTTIKRRIYDALKYLDTTYGPNSKASASQQAVAKAFLDHVKVYVMNSFEAQFQYNPDPTQGIDWQV